MPSKQCRTQEKTNKFTFSDVLSNNIFLDIGINHKSRLNLLKIMTKLEVEDVKNFSPHLGLWEMSIKDAAELIAVDLWFQGKITAKVPDAESFETYDPELIQALNGYCKKLQNTIISAVLNGTLKTTMIRQDILAEEIDIDNTRLHFLDVCNWLEERSYEPGEAFEDYFHVESQLFEAATHEIRALKSLDRRLLLKDANWVSRLLQESDPEDADVDELRNTVKALSRELSSLRFQLQSNGRIMRAAPEDKPLSSRTRRTLLTLIGVLCKRAKIDYSLRGAAQAISRHTEDFGVRIDEKTIKSFLDEIDDATDSRLKDSADDD